MKKIRFGVLGAGGIADRRTLPAMMTVDNAELVCVMELNADHAERLRAKYGARRAYTDEAELLADPDIDAVYIASPVACHARQAKMAADRGLHILIEKPLALSAAEGAEIVRYCDQRGVKIAAGFMMRFGANVQKMRAAMLEGKLGDLVSAGSLFTCWYPDMPGNWRQSKAGAGGGALMDMGVHTIDLIQYITGQRVCEVAAFSDTMTFAYEVEDAALVIMRLTGGAMATVQANFNIPDAAAKWRLEFFGTRGRMLGDSVIGQVDGGSVDALFVDAAQGYDAEQSGQRGQSQGFDVEFGDMYAREIECFSNSLLTGAPLDVPAADAVYVQRVVEAAYLSAAEKRFVTL